MAGERITLDPIAENSANAPLELNDPDNGLVLLEHAYPVPEEVRQWAESADTEGARLASRRPPNRPIPVKVRVAEPQDPAATNLCTNPKAAVDLTGCTATSLPTFERVSLVGATPGQIEGLAADTAFHMVGDASADRAAFSVAVTGGTTYRFSGWVYLASLSATSLLMFVRSAADVTKGSLSITTVGSWARYSVSFTADATETWTFRFQQSGAGAVDAYFTGVLIEASSSLGPYFDGDSAGCSWTGTRHASTSTRPAPGGARFEAILSDLRAATGKLRRKGGTYRRVKPSGDIRIFDLQAADYNEPTDKRALARRIVDVALTFTAGPYARSAEVDLGDNIETSLPVLIFTETAIPGDAPALGRLVIDDDSAAGQLRAIWSLQHEEYDAASTAELFYEAESRTMTGAALAVGTAGASGAGSNVARHTNLSGPVSSFAASSLFVTYTGGTLNTHVGMFRVFARAYAPASNTSDPVLQLAWSAPQTGGGTVYNEMVSVQRSGWRLVDLGMVTIYRDDLGTHGWSGELFGGSPTNGDDVEVDYLLFMPADEGYGEVEVPVGPATQIIVAHDGVKVGPLSPNRFVTPNYVGGYLLVPPSGLEGRPVRFVVKLSRELDEDPNIDDLSARLYVTPRYLV